MNLELKNKVIDLILNNKELENITIHINNDSYDNIIVEMNFKTNYFSSYKEYSEKIDNCMSNICLTLKNVYVDIKSDNIYKNNIVGLEYERKIVLLIRQC